jgi:hypothetical protein
MMEIPFSEPSWAARNAYRDRAFLVLHMGASLPDVCVEPDVRMREVGVMSLSGDSGQDQCSAHDTTFRRSFMYVRSMGRRPWGWVKPSRSRCPGFPA